MKRLFLLSMLCVSSTIYLWADTFTVKGITYESTSKQTVMLVDGQNVKGDVVIPESLNNRGRIYTVTTIKYGAFSRNDSLTSIVIPEGVTSIQTAAFGFCKALKSVVLPNSLETIGVQTFKGCSNLQEITFGTGLKMIEWGAFSDCYMLKSAIFHEGLEQIDLWAFLNCYELENVVLPSTLKELGARVFDNCHKLNHVVIPDSIQTIKYLTFLGCHSLTDITLPKTLISLDESVFKDCDMLEDIVLPEGLEEMGHNLFTNCTALHSIIIPSSVTTIGTSAFSGCTQLTAIAVDASNPRYDSRGDCNAIIETGTGTLVAGCTSSVIPMGITAIGINAFEGVTLPSSVTIPEGVTLIDDYAFCMCQKLATIILPASLKQVGESAFAWCSSLNDIYCYATEVPQMEPPQTWNGETDLSYITLHVPAESVELYQNADQWNNAMRVVPLTDELTIYRPFIEDGKVWHTGINPGNGFLKRYEYRLFGDTIIDGKTCRVLGRSEVKFNAYSYTAKDTVYAGALYEEGHKVYGAKPGMSHLELLYDFESPVGTDVEIDGDTFTITGREKSKDNAFKGVCTYIQIQGGPEEIVPYWMEGVGGFTSPMESVLGFYPTGLMNEIIISCSLGDEVIYMRDKGIPTDPEVKKQWLDFTHTVKTRPKAPGRMENEKGKGNNEEGGMNNERADGEQDLTGEYSARELFVNLKTLSGTYDVMLKDGAGQTVYQKLVQTNNIVALCTDLTKYAEGSYTLTIENADEAYTATFTLPLVGTGVYSPQMLNGKSVNRKCYDLSGRRLAAPPSKGIYIEDGRKKVAN